MKSGIGGERFVSSSAIIERFSKRFEKKITLGGTSCAWPSRCGKLGYTSALHLVTMNDHVRRLIRRDSPYVCSNSEDSLYPHLIVQFRKGRKHACGDFDISTGRANRIIYLNDADNRRMQLDEEFAGLIEDAEVFLISGFNAMQEEECFVTGCRLFPAESGLSPRRRRASMKTSGFTTGPSAR